jgi:indole-3-glycerol phosphate synthase
MPPMKRLSQAIAEGDGISILVEVRDVAAAEAAERQGADGLVAAESFAATRSSSTLPLLVRGAVSRARALEADAVLIGPDPHAWDETRALELEGVVRATRAEDLERALALFDPEVFLLAAGPSDEDALESLLALLHDVPAGKLAIAELPDATTEDVAELERAGIDAVLVDPARVAALVQVAPPQV